MILQTLNAEGFSNYYVCEDMSRKTALAIIKRHCTDKFTKNHPCVLLPSGEVLHISTSILTRVRNAMRSIIPNKTKWGQYALIYAAYLVEKEDTAIKTAVQKAIDYYKKEWAA